MSKIKSALELAMEKTADLKFDKEAMMRNEAIKEGKRLASLFLKNESDDLKTAIKNMPKEQRKYAAKGALETFLANLVLPATHDDLKKLELLQEGLIQITGEKRTIENLFQQLGQLLMQFLDNKVQLKDALVQQYEPRLRQKEQQILQQTGQEIHLSPEQDQEFMQIYREQLSSYTEQYQNVLKQVKAQLNEL